MKRLVLSILMLSIVAIWGWTFVVVKDAIDSYGIVAFLTLRFFMGSCAIAPFAAGHLNIPALKTGSLIGIVLAISYLFQTFGLKITTPTNAGLITGLFIVFTPIANHFLFSVKTSFVYWLAICTSIFGLLLLTGSAPRGINSGDLLVLGCALSFGLHVALLDRYAKEHNTAVLVFGQLSSATVVFLLTWLFITRDPVKWPSPDVWLAIAITGLLATAAGFFVQTFVQQRLSAIETAVLIALEPPFAAFFGYLLAGDRLNLTQVFGGALMVCAVFLAELYPLLFNGQIPSMSKQ